MRLRATGVILSGRSTLTPCQNVESEFITHAATVATTYLLSTLQTTVSCAHVFTPVDSYLHLKPLESDRSRYIYICHNKANIYI